MADEQKNSGVLMVGGLIIAAAVSGFVGLQFAGGQQSERIQAADVGQIDVLREQISAVRTDLDKVSADTLSRTELDSRLDTINETIIRRFGEDVQIPIDQVRSDAEKNEDSIFDIAQRIARIEALLSALSQAEKGE